MELMNFEIRNTIVGKPQKCSICGKEYKKVTVGKDRFQITCYEAQCTCEKDLAMQKEKERIKKVQRINNAALLSKRFDNSMLSKRLRKMEFENLDQSMNIKEINFCKNFVKTFDTETSTGIQMLGNTGAGKSSLLACICNGLIRQGYNCLFTTLSNLISDFVQYSGENYGNINSKLNWLLRFDFIVLDDIGRENLTEKRKEVLFQIVDALYNEEKVIAFTANPEMITKLKKDKELEAILNRLKALCPNSFEFHGKSLR